MYLLNSKCELLLENKFILKTLSKYLIIDITVTVESIKDLLMCGNIVYFSYSEKNVETWKNLKALTILQSLSHGSPHICKQIYYR